MVREYSSLSHCGVGHAFEKEETRHPIGKKSQRVIHCTKCNSATVVIRSRPYGPGRRKKERFYNFGGRDNDWVCKYATPEEIKAAKERMGSDSTEVSVNLSPSEAPLKLSEDQLAIKPDSVNEFEKVLYEEIKILKKEAAGHDQFTKTTLQEFEILRSTLKTSESFIALNT